MLLNLKKLTKYFIYYQKKKMSQYKSIIINMKKYIKIIYLIKYAPFNNNILNDLKSFNGYSLKLMRFLNHISIEFIKKGLFHDKSNFREMFYAFMKNLNNFERESCKSPNIFSYIQITKFSDIASNSYTIQKENNTLSYNTNVLLRNKPIHLKW